MGNPIPASSPPSIDPNIVWTVGGEAGPDTAGRLAVASVVRNRANIAGAEPADIVTEPGQFQAYTDNLATNQKRFPIGSPQYTELASQIAPVITGQAPPTVPYTGFRTHGASPGWNGKAPVATIGGNDFAAVPYEYSGAPAVNQASDAEDFANIQAGKAPAPGAVQAAPLPPIAGSTVEGGADVVTPQDVQDFYKQHPEMRPTGPMPTTTTGPTLAGTAEAFGSGALGSIGGLTGLVPGSAQMLANVASQADTALSLFDPKDAATLEAARQQYLPTAGEQQSALGLTHQPANLTERIANTAGEMAPGAFIPGSALARVANVAVPALGARGLGESARAMGLGPGEQQAAEAVGGIAGGFGAGAVTGGASALSDIASPFVANISRGARETQAGQILANASGAGFREARSALDAYQPLVPGSPATVGDVTGNLGLIGLSRSVATKGSEAYTALTGEQAVQRAKSLATLNTGGDPVAVQAHIKGTIDNLDAQTQAGVDAATQAAQAKTQAIGGIQSPDTYGAQIRSGVQDALKASDANESQLWDAIDPNGTLTGNVGATRVAAKGIAGNLTADDLPMTGPEKTIFDRVANWPDILPLKNIVAMRKQINAVASDAKIGGNDVTYGRLSALRGALADNLSTTIGDAVAKPGTASRYQAWENGQQPPNAGAASGVAGGSNQPPSAVGTTDVAGAGGTALPPSSGPGGAPGAASLSGQISPDLKPIMVNGQVAGYTTPTGETISATAARGYAAPPTAVPAPVAPTIDAAAQARMAAANQATAQQAQTFRQGPVASTLNTYGYQGQFKMPPGSVPSQFFKPGPTGFSSMQALTQAAPDAMPAIQDYAASTLRNAKYMTPDGVLTPQGYAKWQADYGDAIRALPPQLQAKFADAASAGQTVADAQTARKAAMDAAQAGAIGKIVGLPAGDAPAVTKTVGGILNGATAQTDMTALVNATKNNPDAFQGLRQAVIDHVTNTLTSNTEASASGTDKLRADQFQSFAKQKVPILVQSGVLTAPEGARLTATADDIQQSQRTLGATKLPGQSNTPQDVYAGGLPGAGKPNTMLDLLGAQLGGLVGASVHGAMGIPMGEATAGILTHVVQSLRSSGINKVNDLVKAAVFDPKFAAALMSKVNGPTDIQNSGRTLVRALVAPTIAAQSPTPPRQAVPLSQSIFGSRIPPPAPRSAFAGIPAQ